MAQDDLPIIAFATPAAWEAWLEEHAEGSAGVRVKFARKATGIQSVTHAEVLELALCFGWIDGQTRRIDEGWWTQRFAPRRPRSTWSKVNREKAEALIASGRMRPAGLAEVERARADGRWEAAYDPPSRAKVPDDLRDALVASPTAAEAFKGLDSRNRYAILYRLDEAKRPETRARRLEKFVAMLAAGETLHPRR